MYRKNAKTKVIPLVEDDIYSFAFSYEVYDFYLKDTENITTEMMINFRNECQIFIDKLPLVFLNKYFKMLAVNQTNNEFGFKPIKMDKRVIRIYKNFLNLPIQLKIYAQLIVTSHNNVIPAMKFAENIPSRRDAFKDEIETIINVIKTIFDLEMEMKRNNMELLFIRRLLEEYLSSLMIAKHNLIHPITKIYSYLKYKGVNIEDMEFFKFKHIQKNEGLRYISSDGNVIGSEAINMDEVFKVIEYAFNYLTEKEPK